MSQVKRTIRIITRQDVLDDRPPASEGFPFRKWSIRIICINAAGEEVPASFLDRVTYKLHPTFQNPNRTIKKPPFQVDEIGWGEFDMGIVLYYVDKGGEVTLRHDLNFQSNEYNVDHNLSVNTARPGLARALTESGTVPGYDEGDKKRRKGEADVGAKKRSKTKPVDMEKLADAMQRLDEDSLLQIVQMIDDHKTPDVYVKNDIEEGEFHVDLYTLSDTLLVNLWNFTSKKVSV